ncbi:alpha/beta-Hydrolases superfamily protein, partial [Prunus dulcis]
QTTSGLKTNEISGHKSDFRAHKRLNCFLTRAIVAFEAQTLKARGFPPIPKRPNGVSVHMLKKRLERVKMALSVSSIATLTRFSSFYFNRISKRFSSRAPTKTHNRPQMSFSSSSPTEPKQSEKISAPYGSWKSQITADVVSGASKRLGGTAVDSLGRLIWLESRPSESGRAVLVREPDRPEGESVDITPKDYAVRTLAQEYGGGAFSVSGDTLIFSNYKDQRLYKQSLSSNDSSPVPLTPDYGGPVVSYADGVFDARFNRFVTVQEDRRQSSTNSTTTIVTVGLDGKNIREPEVLVGGTDFYAFPRLDPKGERLAWIEWCHPNMPWDQAQLWLGIYLTAEKSINESVLLALILRLRSLQLNPSGPLKVESNNEVISVYSLDAEFSKPLWVFGINSYEFIQSHEQKNNGRSYLGILDDAQGSLSLLNIPFTDIDNITLGINCVYVEGASEIDPLSVAKVTLDEDKSKAVDFKIIWSSSPDCLKYKSYFSLPELIEFPTVVPGQTAFAYFYPPSNPNYQATHDEKPPMLLKSHGGPTAESRGILNLSVQYWTSRGWAYVDVNYGGSTGYGREYRERLLKKWGIVDVDDCCSCAKYLVGSGKADGERLCITGGSAGGYTTLAALAFRDTFKAGASLYGVADLNMLRAETHKFESHYIDNLVGSEKDYYDRSPINFADKFSCPIILFQGLEDKVVPPDQARKIYKALKEKGLPVALVEYEGEQHGFRKAENIKFTLEQQMVFFARLVGRFKVADEINPIKIDNFD